MRALSQNVAPGLVTKELTHARSCARRSTHNIALRPGERVRGKEVLDVISQRDYIRLIHNVLQATFSDVN